MQSIPPDLTVRRTAPADLPSLQAMAERCTPETLRRRFHGAGSRPIRRELARIAASTPVHRSWVVASGDGRVHGSATLAWGRSGAVDTAFLVEDAWFRRGLGRALFAAVTAEAVRAHLVTLVATIQADNDRAVRFLRAVAPDVRPRYVGGAELELTVSLADAVRQRAVVEPAREAA